MSKPRIYWDTSTWVAWNKNEFDARETCDHLLQDAQTGALEIVTSAITLAEFVPPSEADDMLLESYLSRSGFVVVAVNRSVAQTARGFCRRFGKSHGLRGVDATHLASSIYAGCSVLHTYDEKHLLKIADNVSEIQICKPTWTGQIELGPLTPD